MTVADARQQARRIVTPATTTISITGETRSSHWPGRDAGSCDRARLIFIQVSGPDVMHIRREIAADGCDVAIAEDADQALRSLAGDTPHVLDCSSATCCDVAGNGDDGVSQARLRRPLIVLLMPKCRTDPEVGRIAMMMMSESRRADEGPNGGGGAFPAAAGSRAANETDATGRSVLIRGDIEIDLTTYRACRDKRPLHLSLTCFRLLLALMENPEHVCTREHLIRRTRGERGHAHKRLIDTHISRLRRVLCADGGRNVIRTVRGVGYAFTDDPNETTAVM